MHVCPRGHESQSADYCDECGAPIGGAGAAVLPGAAAPSGASVASPSVGTQHASAQSTTVGAAATLCPECNTPASGRFCESCGFDLLMATLAPAVEPAGAATPTTATPAGAAIPESATPDTTTPDTATPAETVRPVETAMPVEPGRAAPDAAAPDVAATGVAWRLVVTADAAYHQRMQSEPDAEPIAFPTYCPERRFVLDGQQVLIGRRSRSRGIEPQIDLSGPPEDPAVSHAHALLVRQPDGGWAVVDLDSANGTYVNDATDPIRANEPVPLADGDRVHVGAWTTLTLLAVQ